MNKTIQTTHTADSLTYKGKFQDFSSMGEAMQKPYSLRDTKRFYTEQQNFLYRRAVYGLDVFPAEEVKQMCWQKRKRISKVHKRAQEEINKLKQMRLIQWTNEVFKLLHHSKVAKGIIKEHSQPDPKFFCDQKFKDLRLRKEDIVNHLIGTGVLPHDFDTR